MALRAPARPLSRRDVFDRAVTRLTEIFDRIETRKPTHQNTERSIGELEDYAEQIRTLARGMRK